MEIQCVRCENVFDSTDTTNSHITCPHCNKKTPNTIIPVVVVTTGAKTGLHVAPSKTRGRFSVQYSENGKDRVYLHTLNPDLGKHNCRQIFKENPKVFEYEDFYPLERIKEELGNFLSKMYIHGKPEWDSAAKTFEFFEKRGVESQPIHHLFRIKEVRGLHS